VSLYATLIDSDGRRVEEGRRFSLRERFFLPVLVFSGRVYMRSVITHGALGVYQEAPTHYVDETPSAGIRL